MHPTESPNKPILMDIPNMPSIHYMIETMDLSPHCLGTLKSQPSTYYKHDNAWKRKEGEKTLIPPPSPPPPKK